MPIIFAYLADVLMILASAGAAGYCLVLSRRLSRLTSFDKGIGGAIAVLSAQVDDMKAALTEAKAGTDGAGKHLYELVHQARDISSELELMIAACHDFAEEALVVQNSPADGAGPEVNSIAQPQAKEPAPRQEVMESEEVPETPVFGTRRLPPPELVFRHNAAARA